MKTSCPSPAEIERRLRSAGVRPTAQRIALARYALCEADHPTAERVKAWADRNFPKMSLATVYNTLNALVTAGLLKKIFLPNTRKAVYDDNVAEHHHLLDLATGRIIDLPMSAVRVSPRLDGMRVRSIEVFIRARLLKHRSRTTRRKDD